MAFVRSCRWGRVLSAFLLLWLLCLVYFLASLATKSGETETALREKLRRAELRSERLSEEVAELRGLLREAQDKKLEHSTSERTFGGDNHKGAWSDRVSRVVDGPSLEYEESRRRAGRDVRELWWFVRAGLQTVLAKEDAGEEARKVAKETLEGARHRKAAVMADLDKMRETDGFETWRTQVRGRGKYCHELNKKGSALMSCCHGEQAGSSEFPAFLAKHSSLERKNRRHDCRFSSLGIT